MVIALSIFALTLAGKLAFDYKLHLAGKKINHKKEAVIVFILLVVASFFACGGLKYACMIYLPCFLSIFWALFDSGFGLLIARNPFFLGDSSWLDRVQKKEPALQVAKYLLAIGSIIFFILKSGQSNN